MQQKFVIKLTDTHTNQSILLGVPSIINAKRVLYANVPCTKIQSRGAMVETVWVNETVEKLINAK